MFTYNATIPETLAPAGLIPSQLTSRPGWNFTYNNISDRATSDLKASQLTSCNHPLSVTNRFVCYLRLLRFTLRKKNEYTVYASDSIQQERLPERLPVSLEVGRIYS